MTIPLPADTRPRTCPGCGEFINDPFSGAHLSCTHRPNPPAAPAWPVAKREDPVARRAAAIAEARGLLEQLRAEVGYLGERSPAADVVSLHDQRVHGSALGRIEDIARELRELLRRVRVVRNA